MPAGYSEVDAFFPDFDTNNIDSLAPMLAGPAAVWPVDADLWPVKHCDRGLAAGEG